MRLPVDDSLFLSQVTMADAPYLVRYLNNAAIVENTLMIPSPYTLSDAGWYINYVEDRKNRFGQLTEWAVRDADGRLLGGAGFQVAYGIESHKDALGYWLGEPFWGRGIGTKVVGALTAWAFESRKLLRVEAPIFVQNRASARVLEKNGYLAEGTLRNCYLKDGQPTDALMYAKVSTPVPTSLPA